MKPNLSLGRSRLRPIEDADAGRLEAILTTQRVRRFLCDDRVLTGVEIAAIIQDSHDHNADGLGLWAIETTAGSVAGFIGLMPVTGPLETVPRMMGRVEPTIALDPGFWGQGIAQDALTGVIGYARDGLDLPELVAAVDVPNDRSHRLLRACGFRGVGETAGAVHDLVLYALQLNLRAEG